MMTGCASQPVDQVDLMPAPDVYGDGLLDPLPKEMPYASIPYRGILYATDRQPAGPNDDEQYYSNDRGTILRVGVARIQLGTKDFKWETARAASLLKNRTDAYPIKVGAVEEWGILGRTVPFFTAGKDMDGAALPPDASGKLAEQVNAQLAKSKRKHVYLYVHGYKVVYENPVLVASELWHFMGYNGVFIAYAWPSTPSKFAYVKDSDTSQGFARNFRQLLECRAEETAVEEIHILGYSNGTRRVARALEQLALKYSHLPAEQIQSRTRIGEVILVGSDIDRGVFGSYLTDGLLNTSRHLTVYMSKYDKALGMSQFLTRRNRLGQMFDEETISPAARNLLDEFREQVSVVNISEVEGSKSANGHGYFRESPWASSDILMTLAYGLGPEQRGLVRQSNVPVFEFPEDYVARLWDALSDADPVFAEAYVNYRRRLEDAGTR
jgi:esterase/lipase superfamily enzyme